MKTASVADLRNNFAVVSKWIHAGESVVITKRGRPFASLNPVQERAVPPPLDRMARLRRIFGTAPAKGDVRSVLDYDRGDR